MPRLFVDEISKLHTDRERKKSFRKIYEKACVREESIEDAMYQSKLSYVSYQFNRNAKGIEYLELAKLNEDDLEGVARNFYNEVVAGNSSRDCRIGLYGKPGAGKSTYAMATLGDEFKEILSVLIHEKAKEQTIFHYDASNLCEYYSEYSLEKAEPLPEEHPYYNMLSIGEDSRKLVEEYRNSSFKTEVVEHAHFEQRSRGDQGFDILKFFYVDEDDEDQRNMFIVPSDEFSQRPEYINFKNSVA